MFSRWRLSRLDTALIIVLIVAAVIAFFLGRTKADAGQELARLEVRASAAQINLSEVDKGIDQEALRQSLEQAQEALAESPFPNEAEAAAVTVQILRYAKANNITIVQWDSGYTSARLGGTTYSALSHTLSATGTADAVTRFVKALTRGSASLAVGTLNISAVTGESDLWEIELGLLVYFR